MTTNPSIPVEAEFTLFRPKLMGLKRRKARRFRCGLATLGKLSVPGKQETLDACVFNISHTGMGLDMPHAMEAGEAILIKIRMPGEVHPIQLAAHIVHATELVDRTWRIGCRFDEPISDDLLETLLS